MDSGGIARPDRRMRGRHPGAPEFAMNRSLSSSLALVLLGAAGAAQAQYYDEPDPYYDDGAYAEYDARYDTGYGEAYPQDDGYPAPAYGYGAQGGESRDYARVLSVDPIVERGRPVVQQQCWREPAPAYARDDRYYGQPRARTSGNGAVLGAIVGGVLGNSVGSGDGRQAATAVGAVVGGMVGNSMERNARERDYAAYHGRTHRVAEVERCRTVQVAGGDAHVVGYRVTYEYAGRTFETTTSHHPGDTLPVRVLVTPES